MLLNSMRLGNISWDDQIEKLNLIGTINLPDGGLSVLTFKPVFKLFKDVGSSPKEIYLKANAYSPIRGGSREYLDIEHNRELTAQGILAHMWGASFIINKFFPHGQILCVDDKNNCVLIKVPGNEFFRGNI